MSKGYRLIFTAPLIHSTTSILTIVAVLIFHAYQTVYKPYASHKKYGCHHIRNRIAQNVAHPNARTQTNRHEDERKYHYCLIDIPHNNV